MNMKLSKADNGVNVDALLAAREALTAAPAAAKFRWRATSAWVKGTHSQSTVEGFSGLGREHRHKTSFRFDADHPEPGFHPGLALNLDEWTRRLPDLPTLSPSMRK